MGTVHLLNVGPGDCTIIQHNRGRVSMLDICCGNSARAEPFTLSKALSEIAARTNFKMCDKKTQPLDYLEKAGIKDIFRFILSHPDMDHMDGLAALLREIRITNFWDSGVRRTAPDFSDDFTRFKEEDWDAYEALIEGSAVSRGGAAVKRLQVLAGQRFSFANEPEGQHDGLYILAPDKQLRDEASESPDTNDGSYALLYRSSGGRIILPGDAYDETWDHVIAQYASSVIGCAFLLAPHHGRDSDRSYDYLDVLNPTLTLMGCAPAKHVSFHEWDKRGLQYITSDQAGTVVLKTAESLLDVYVENQDYAKTFSAYNPTPDELGHFFVGTIADRAG